MIRISKMKLTRNMKDEFIVFYLQFINSLEDLGMFFSYADLIRRLRKYTATLLDPWPRQHQNHWLYIPKKIAGKIQTRLCSQKWSLKPNLTKTGEFALVSIFKPTRKFNLVVWFPTTCFLVCTARMNTFKICRADFTKRTNLVFWVKR